MRRLSLAIAISSILGVVLSGCGNEPMPYDATSVRDDARAADESISEMVSTLTPDGIALLASQRVDFCVDEQSRAPFQGDAPSYSCYVADLRVFELPHDVAEAATLVDAFLLDQGFDADLYTDRAAADQLEDGADGVVRQQLGIDAQRDLISTLAVGPSSVFTAWWPPGSGSRVISTSGDSLYAEQVSEYAQIDCDCAHWWLIVVERYAAALRP